MSDDHAILLSGVTKTFRSTTAVRDLDLRVPRGAIYGFIGPNGAGKTTTIRMIMSILFPDAGEIRVLGRRSAFEAKDRIGYLPEERGVYRKMKVGAFLRYIAHLKGMGGTGLRRDVDDWLERVELSDVRDKPCEELSKGMQQKIQFVAAVLHKPDLLILDEPFSGLDPVNMRLLRDLVREEHQRGTTLIFSTHVMFQAEQLCEHIVMIHDGVKVLDDSLEDIRSQHNQHAVVVEPQDGETDAAALATLRGVENVERADAQGSYKVHLAADADRQTVMREIVAAVPTQRLELHRPTLEDIFIAIVSASRGGEQQELRDALRGAEEGEEAVS